MQLDIIEYHSNFEKWANKQEPYIVKFEEDVIMKPTKRSIKLKNKKYKI